MKPAMTMHLTMVVVAGASFGRSRFRSEPFLRRVLENFENFQKPGQKRLRNGFFGENAKNFRGAKIFCMLKSFKYKPTSEFLMPHF